MDSELHFAKPPIGSLQRVEPLGKLNFSQLFRPNSLTISGQLPGESADKKGVLYEQWDVRGIGLKDTGECYQVLIRECLEPANPTQWLKVGPDVSA